RLVVYQGADAPVRQTLRPARLGHDVAGRLLDLLAQVLQRLFEHLIDEHLLVLVLILALVLLSFLFGVLLGSGLLLANDVAVIAPASVLDALLARQRHLHAGIGLDAPLIALLAVGEAVDVLAAGSPVARRRQLQGALPVLHRDDVLHAALAVAAFPDND